MLNPDINSLPLFIEEANIGKQLQQSMVNAGYFGFTQKRHQFIFRNLVNFWGANPTGRIIS